MKIILSILFIIVLTKCNSQVKKETNVPLVNDSFDNFTATTKNDSLPFFILDKDGKEIIFQKTFQGNLCKECYEELIVIAEKYKRKTLFEDAIRIYNIAFRLNGNLGKVKDRYNAAICFSKLGQVDSAFIQLKKIANGGKYNYLEEIKAENAFNNLHVDPRWSEIIEKIKKNLQEYADKLDSNIEGYEIKNQ